MLVLQQKAGHGTPGHLCLTGCAATYHGEMAKKRKARRLGVSDIPLIQIETVGQNEEEGNENKNVVKDNEKNDKIMRRQSTGNMKKLQDLIAGLQVTEASTPARRQSYNQERRLSVYRRLVQSKEPDHLQGAFSLVASHNFDQFLKKIGTGPLSLNMVMRASVILTITKTPDEHWEIGFETGIKAKSVVGYSTCNRKMTKNKFLEGVPKPELVDDWDQRLVVTTLSLDQVAKKLILIQTAEKDQRFCLDSKITFNVAPDDTDKIIATYEIDGVKAERMFRRQTQPSLALGRARRHSVI